MKIKATDILESIKKREGSGRKPVNMYLSAALWEKFQGACDDVSPSKVIEILIKQFLDSKNQEEKKK